MRFFIDTITTTVIKHDNLDFSDTSNYPNSRNFIIVSDSNLVRLVKIYDDEVILESKVSRLSKDTNNGVPFFGKLTKSGQIDFITIINQYKIELRKSKLNKI